MKQNVFFLSIFCGDCNAVCVSVNRQTNAQLSTVRVSSAQILFHLLSLQVWAMS